MVFILRRTCELCDLYTTICGNQLYYGILLKETPRHNLEADARNARFDSNFMHTLPPFSCPMRDTEPNWSASPSLVRSAEASGADVVARAVIIGLARAAYFHRQHYRLPLGF